MTKPPEINGSSGDQAGIPEPDGAPQGERIAKLLARAGIASRREVERIIAEGRVKLNGVVVTTPATILPDLRGLTVDDTPVAAPEATRLFLFHKPSGLLTAERDPAGRPTIYAALRNALPPGSPRVMPVGRLDLNTEGLLLLTNDGELKRAMELPSSQVPRTYRARTYGDISQDRLEELIEGIEIDGFRYGKIDANMERRTGRNQWIELTMTEGKNREVRRVLEHLGLEVSRLLRIAYGPFVLGNLPRGMAGEIAPSDVEKFRRTLGMAAQDPGTVRRTVRVSPERAPAAPETARRAPYPGRAGPRTGRPDAGAARPDARTARTDTRGPRPDPRAPRPDSRTARPDARSTRPDAPYRGRGPATQPTAEPEARPTVRARPLRRRDEDAAPLMGRDEARGRGRGRHHPQTPSSKEEGASRPHRDASTPPPLQRRGPGGGEDPKRPSAPGQDRRAPRGKPYADRAPEGRTPRPGGSSRPGKPSHPGKPPHSGKPRGRRP